MKKSRAINVHLGPELKERWQKYCESQGKSPGVMIREAIEKQLQNTETLNDAQPLTFPSDEKAAVTDNSRPEKMSAATRQSVEDRILEALERLVEKGKSFNSVTVEQLAKEAGIARATFYVHFADKSELVVKLMNRLTTDVVGSAGVWFNPDDESSEQVNLKKTLTGIFTTFKKHQAIHSAIIATASHDDTVARLHNQMIAELCAQSRKAILKNTDGQFPGKVSAEMLADVLTQIIALFCAHNIVQYNASQLDALTDTFAHICQQSIFYKSNNYN